LGGLPSAPPRPARSSRSSSTLRIAPAKARVVGCGYDLLEALLALDHPERYLLAIDPDTRKIARARLGLGRLPNVELRVGVIEDLEAEDDGSFHAILVAQVLWILPAARWPDFPSRCRRLLKPDGEAARLIVGVREARRAYRRFHAGPRDRHGRREMCRPPTHEARGRRRQAQREIAGPITDLQRRC
jgi:hypothetical protein